MNLCLSSTEVKPTARRFDCLSHTNLDQFSVPCGLQFIPEIIILGKFEEYRKLHLHREERSQILSLEM